MKTYKPKIRLYIEDKIATNNIVEIDVKQAHYLIKVMRCKNGDKISIFNQNDGEYLAELIDANAKSCKVTVKDNLHFTKKLKDLCLCFAPIKNAPLANLIQKATELGVTKLQPVITQRTILNQVNTERLRMIAIEASEQCLRVDIPKINDAITLNQMLVNWNKDYQIIMCDETGAKMSIKNKIEELSNKPLSFLIGPEGGFGEKDFEIIDNFKEFIHKVSMGSRILRADTAAISAITCYQTLVGDWNE